MGLFYHINSECEEYCLLAVCRTCHVYCSCTLAAEKEESGFLESQLLSKVFQVFQVYHGSPSSRSATAVVVMPVAASDHVHPPRERTESRQSQEVIPR